MLTLVRKLIRETEGQTMAEYAFILMLVALAVIGTLSAVGEAIKAKVETVSAAFP
ncbi:MAG: Flp family type IVb pilin [bacterium]|jgi:pilus assembly protein Flp/PilA|nr:Flp family type IVb pilin [Bacillota bacterium]